MGLLIKSLELESRTAKHPLAPVYLVIGEEDYLRDKALATLKRAVLGEEDAGFNCDWFHGDEDAADRVLSCAMEIPVFAPRRLVVLKQADKWPAKETEKCLPYLNAPHESTILVFVAAKLDRRLKWTQTLIQQAVVVDCDPLPDRQVPAWITEEATSFGITVQEDAVQLLKEAAGGSLYALRRELEKLSAYVPAGRPVLIEDVEALRGREPGASVFDLIIAIGAGAMGRAFTILARNLDAGEAPLRILGALVWQYRRLWKVKDSTYQGGRAGEAGRALRMDPARAIAILSQFSESHLHQAFRLFMEADSKLKGGSGGTGKRVLEDLMLQLCRRPKIEGKPASGPAGGLSRKPAGAKPVSNIRTIRTEKR